MVVEPGAPVSVEHVEPGPLGPRDARVRVEASGVCRTDLWTVQRSRFPLPCILGHEGAGTVVEIGTDVSRVRVGDRVIASFVPNCGHCFYCARGQSTQCEAMMPNMMSPRARFNGGDVMAMTGLGTFAELMTVVETALVPVHTDLPSEQLALIGCGVTTGAGAALWTAKVEPGSTVAVFGCGGVGQFVIQGAVIAGAAKVFAIDPVEMKRKTAESAGATHLIDPGDGDVVEQLRMATGGRGVDYAFEVIGDPEVMLQAYNSVRPRGMAVVVGSPPADAVLSLPAATLFQEKRLVGSFYGSSRAACDFPTLVQLAESGRLNIASAVTRIIDLDDVNEAFGAMERGEVIRSVITPS
jgi:S-(hydroxymethyl)glutathione dehydrogenase / alcohol dehydrogenase